MSDHASMEIEKRVRAPIKLYGDPRASAAQLLCDRYKPEALAYKIVGADLSAREVTYGELRRASEQFAGALQSLGVGPGDRVATLMGKSWSYLMADHHHGCERRRRRRVRDADAQKRARMWSMTPIAQCVNSGPKNMTVTIDSQEVRV